MSTHSACLRSRSPPGYLPAPRAPRGACRRERPPARGLDGPSAWTSVRRCQILPCHGPPSVVSVPPSRVACRAGRARATPATARRTKARAHAWRSHRPHLRLNDSGPHRMSSRELRLNVCAMPCARAAPLSCHCRATSRSETSRRRAGLRRDHTAVLAHPGPATADTLHSISLLTSTRTQHRRRKRSGSYIFAVAAAPRAAIDTQRRTTIDDGMRLAGDAVFTPGAGESGAAPACCSITLVVALTNTESRCPSRCFAAIRISRDRCSRSPGRLTHVRSPSGHATAAGGCRPSEIIVLDKLFIRSCRAGRRSSIAQDVSHPTTVINASPQTQTRIRDCRPSGVSARAARRRRCTRRQWQ